MEHLFPYPKMGYSFLEVLHDPLTRKLLGFEAVHAEKVAFVSGVTSRLKFLLSDATQQLSFLKIGYTALEAFLQANCTGPPLAFAPEESIFPETYREDEGVANLRRALFDALSVDGGRPYALTPHIELFWLAKVIFSHPVLAEAGFNGRRARFRVAFWHQKLLSEESPTLRDAMYADADVLEQQLGSRLAYGGAAAEEHMVEFLVERAVVRTHYGDDASARADLARAATTRQFQFVLTGALGRRTKFQDRDISQLVVLAKSRDHEPEPYTSRKGSRAELSSESRKGSEEVGVTPAGSRPLPSRSKSPHARSPALPAMTPISPPPPPPTTPAQHRPTTPPPPAANKMHQSEPPPPPMSPLSPHSGKPENLPLNDDTLLERIHFRATLAPVSEDAMTHVLPPDSTLPPQLAVLDPADQPLLHPMDSIILLATASSISNTSPDDGLVREETLPYATRVLDGGSSNWQVYTQALLVRSRIEGYRARTAERGLLQLQALVDQVIAETSEPAATAPSTGESEQGVSDQPSSAPSTFLPKPRLSESASVAERLLYVYQLSPPLRWELEAELAARWTQMGGLKTALEIYERLQMHAEVALCLAATDQENNAVKLLKELLFEGDADERAQPAGAPSKLRSPLTADGPRLLCILGDITGLASYYTLAWTASSNRYARAQRSLGRYHAKQRDFGAAAEAYSSALAISRLDRASWFALGCVQLEVERWLPATESFTRCVQLEDDDAESWSNLAVALLRLPKPVPVAGEEQSTTGAAVDESPATATDPYRHTREALRALRRAATLRRDDARIWDNYLTVAASIPPSAGTPWAEVVQAMSRVVELRAKREGERCVDVGILRVLIQHVTGTWTYPTSDSDPAEGESAIADDSDDTPKPEAQKLPHLPRSLLTLVDTQIAPLATSSAELYRLLSQLSEWRRRPAQSLGYAEKSWRATLTAISMSEQFDDVPPQKWRDVVDATVWVMGRYRALGPRERERTGGQVEPKWQFKAKSAGRRVLGRGKAWEESGDEAWARLSAEVDSI